MLELVHSGNCTPGTVHEGSNSIERDSTNFAPLSVYSTISNVLQIGEILALKSSCQKVDFKDNKDILHAGKLYALEGENGSNKIKRMHTTEKKVKRTKNIV